MFRKINENDRELYISYVTKFYNSDAVEEPAPKEYYSLAFDELMKENSLLSCYFFLVDDKECGFVLLSKTYSQAAGGISITIEEIYVDEEYRGKGLATEFLDYLKNEISPERIRLEVEDYNEGAKRLYERMGFEEIPYIQMVIDKGKSK